MPKVRRALAAIALANLALLAVHGWVHRALGVDLTSFQTVVVYGVIVPGPILTLLLLTRFPRAAALVLLVSMAASLLFGAIFHYVLASPDNVATLPYGLGRGVFRASAGALALAEALGFVVALHELRRTAVKSPGAPTTN